VSPKSHYYPVFKRWSKQAGSYVKSRVTGISFPGEKENASRSSKASDEDGDRQIADPDSQGLSRQIPQNPETERQSQSSILERKICRGNLTSNITEGEIESESGS